MEIPSPFISGGFHSSGERDAAIIRVGVSHGPQIYTARAPCGEGRRSMNPAPVRSNGFTLLELSIVLMLIGIILGGGLVTFSAYLQSSQFNATVKKMDDIEKALLNFTVANGRIPCPSDVTQTVGSTIYGYEAGAGAGSTIGVGTGACTGIGMLPQANFSAANGQVEGGVPTRALQLPDSYMYDGWGRLFSYAVDPTATKTNALPAHAGGDWCGDPITVLDATGAARSTGAIYVIVSHGANGHGAYTSGGATLSASSDNKNEQINCHCDNNGVSQGYPITTYQPSGTATGLTTPTYVEMTPTLDANDPLDKLRRYRDVQGAVADAEPEFSPCHHLHRLGCAHLHLCVDF